MRKVWVLGSANIDVTLRVPSIARPGETVLARTRAVATGGKGANQAIAIAHWGVPVSFIGAVGTDMEGTVLRDALLARDVDTAHLAHVAGVPSGSASVTVSDTGENAITVYPGANQCVSPAAIESIDFAADDIVVAQLEINTDAIVTAFSLARRAGASTVLNPSPISGFVFDLLPLSSVVIANEHEAGSLAGRAVTDQASAAACAERIRRLGPETVVITMGALGATVHRADGSFHCPVPAVSVVDTQGAGDAFLGAYVARLWRDGDHVRALEESTRVSAYSVSRAGSTQVSLPDAGATLPLEPLKASPYQLQGAGDDRP